MRWFFQDFISDSEAESLAQASTGKSYYNGSQKELIFQVFLRIAEKIENLTGTVPGISGPSYLNIEQRDSGHPAHKDTGTSNHMMWCAYGATILVNKPESGGELTYPEHSESVGPDQHYKSLILHTSDEVHQVAPSSGGRKVFIAFFGKGSK